MEKEIKKNESQQRFGNKNKKLFKNKADFERVFNLYLQHLRSGFREKTFPECDFRTVEAHILGLKDGDLFQAELDKAKRECELLYEKIGYDLIVGEKMGNAGVYQFIMKNKFNWKDKTEIETNSTEKITISFVD
jgi:hypothetical protein